MSNETRKWNRPGFPWELELITLCFFIIALLAPYYFQPDGVSTNALDSSNALEFGRNNLSTQFGLFWSLGVVALYVFHIAFAAMDSGKITASPLHLFSPCAFSMIAYYRISHTGGYEDSALSFIDGTWTQALILLAVVGVITAVFTRLRTYRYMLNFETTNWDIVKPASYDMSYFRLMAQLEPLIYAPRRYLASNEGIVIEGWFYAMPISFSRVHSISKISGTGILNTGSYYTSSTHNLVRMEMHDAIKATYISPEDRDEFVRYCAQHIARRTVSHHTPGHTRGGSKPGTRAGTSAGKTNHGSQTS